MISSKKIYVMYHGGCPDGFSGAWAAWQKFGSRAEYVPLYERDKLPEKVRNKEIYLIDWTYSEPLLRELIAQNKRVICIDHHITAKDTMKLAADSFYNINNSGAVLAWQYFHPKHRLPELLKYVEDYDLYRFKYPETKAVSAELELTSKNFSEWSIAARELEKTKGLKEWTERGEAILRYRSALVKELASTAETVSFAGRKVLAVNAPSALRDELGNVLARKKPPFGIVWRRENGKLRLSLRAVKSYDLRDVLRNFPQAGGHKQAAGITLPGNASLPWKNEK